MMYLHAYRPAFSIMGVLLLSGGLLAPSYASARLDDADLFEMQKYCGSNCVSRVFDEELAKLQEYVRQCMSEVYRSGNVKLPEPGSPYSLEDVNCMNDIERRAQEHARERCSAIAVHCKTYNVYGENNAVTNFGSATPCRPGLPGCSTQETTAPIPLPAEARPKSAPSGTKPTTGTELAKTASDGKSGGKSGTASASKADANGKPTTGTTAQQPNSPVQSVYQDPSSAQYEAANDVESCRGSQTRAVRCCGNPMSCTGMLSAAEQHQISEAQRIANSSPSEGGLTEYCAQLNTATTQAGVANRKLASVCAGEQSGCTSTCQSLAAKYQSLMISCNGCAAMSVYSSAYDQLLALQNSCSQLSTRVAQLSRQGVANSGSSGYADACGQMASSDPQSGAFEMPQFGEQKAASQPVGCAANPNAPGCQGSSAQQGTKQASNERDGAAGFAKREGDEQSFNIPDLQDRALDTGYAGGGYDPQSQSYRTIPNNSGGGIPGDDGTSSASLGAATRPTSPGSPGYTTDILGGERSGGYTGGYQAMGNTGYDAGSGAYRSRGVSNRGGREGSKYLGMDLSQYLPGGKLDPNRRVAGSGVRSEINAKEENIWRLISNKMEEKCRLGVLFQCR